VSFSLLLVALEIIFWGMLKRFAQSHSCCMQLVYRDKFCWAPKFRIPIGPKLKKIASDISAQHHHHHVWEMDSLSSDGILIVQGGLVAALR
jgi:hypothetical protein